MKKIILNLAVTLDGFIEGPNGEVDWCIVDDEMDFDGFLENLDTIFYGRVSYDLWGHYIPPATAGEPEQKLWQGVHSKKKIVFSSQKRASDPAHFISTGIAREVTAIKNQGGKDIWLYGGAKLIKTFIDLNLVDVYKISVHPVALGSGKPLFEQLKNRIELKLTGTRTFKSGVVELIYEPQK